MVQEWKKEKVQELVKKIDESPVIGILDMNNLPAPQLQKIKKELRGKAKILMTKKRIIKFAMEKSKKKNVVELFKLEVISPALIFSNENPFKLARFINKNKAPSYAKARDISPKEIVIPAGSTNLTPGPVIGELQKVGVKAQITGENITIREDSVVAREGDEISGQLANILMKLGIKPIEIGLNLVAVYENGVFYKKDILSIDESEYLDNIKQAYDNSFNLALNIGYSTKETIIFLIQRAYQDSYNLAVNTDLITKETVDLLLKKAKSQALSLKEKIPKVKEEKVGEKKENKDKVEKKKEG